MQEMHCTNVYNNEQTQIRGMKRGGDEADFNKNNRRKTQDFLIIGVFTL